MSDYDDNEIELMSDYDEELNLLQEFAQKNNSNKKECDIQSYEIASLNKKILAAQNMLTRKVDALREAAEYFLGPFVTSAGFKKFNEEQKRLKALESRKNWLHHHLQGQFEFANEIEADMMIGNAIDSVLAPKSSGEEWDFESDLEAELAHISVDWLCRGLGLAPGDATIITADPFTGKTYLASYLALCFVSGASVFGKYEIQKKGPIAHINWDSNSQDTKIGYLRLASGMGIRLHKGDIYYEKANWKFNHEVAYENLIKICQGRVFCIIDSLRTCFDGDENSSEAAAVIALANRVSEETGCCILFIAHSGKSGVAGRGLHAVRGTSAIPAAAGAEWNLERTTENNTLRLSCHKGRKKQFADICYTYTETGQLLENIDKTSKVEISLAEGICGGNNDKKDIATQIIQYLTDKEQVSKTELKNNVSGKEEKIYAAIKEMISNGKLVESKDKKDGRKCWIALSEDEKAKIAWTDEK